MSCERIADQTQPDVAPSEEGRAGNAAATTPVGAAVEVRREE